MRELYSIVCGEGGVSPAYFLDEMSIEEVSLFIDGMNKRDRASWEQTRLIGYITAQVNSSKQISQSDIIRFPWDVDAVEKKDTSVSDEEMARLREKAKHFEL